MDELTALESAIQEQIIFLRAELDRIRAGRITIADKLADDEAQLWMRPALQDPGFQAWLLTRELSREAKR